MAAPETADTGELQTVDSCHFLALLVSCHQAERLIEPPPSVFRHLTCGPAESADGVAWRVANLYNDQHIGDFYQHADAW